MSSSSSSLSWPRGSLSACRCLSLPRRSPWPGLFVLGLLQLNEPLDLLATLEVVAPSAVDLAVLLVGTVPLVGNRHCLAVGAPGNLLAGATSLGFLGGVLAAGLLDNQYLLILLLLAVPLPALPCRAGAFTVGLSISDTLSGEFPPLLSAHALVGQSVKLTDLLDLAHGHLLSQPAVTHVLVERADHRGGMDVGDVVVHAAEPLDELAQRLPLLLNEQMEVARLAMGFVAARKGADKLVA